MEKILTFLENKTHGKCYKSFKFCFDSVEFPSVEYGNQKLGGDEQEYEFTDYGETDTSLKGSKNLIELAKKVQSHSPLLRYFLDGSRRVYKIDDIKYDHKVYPIIGGQIGIACCERVTPQHFKPVDLENSLVLSLPDLASADGGNNSDLFFNNLAFQLNGLPNVQRFKLSFSKVLTYSSKNLAGNEKYEDRGIATIQDYMIDCEKRTVAHLVSRNLLNQDTYLIKDGSLQYKPMKTGDYKELSKIKNNYRCVVGISKKFNPGLCKNPKGKSNEINIANLPLYHRTPASMYKNGILGDVKFSIWYIRLRDSKFTDSPFAGIIKVEKLLISEKENSEGLDTEEVDLISAHLLNEKNPVCYGTDNRWANFLYPIYLTEKYIKSKYISDLHFLNLF